MILFLKRRLYFILLLFPYLLNGQISKQWVATFNGDGDFNDRYICSTMDAAGNLIAAGSTSNPEVNRDLLVTKYSGTGSVLWSYLYNGPGSSVDEASAITTDASGNIYVCGFSKGINTSEDYITLKLNNNGVLQWMKFYDFSTDYDQANDIAVDASGNVYVTGQSDGDGTSVVNDDYATIKYTSSGVESWVKRFNGVGSATDRAVKVVIDAAGNCYVTGRSNSGVDDDYVTIKYNSTGGTVWSRYDDRGNNDRPTEMVIDAADNIYITGRSGNGNNYDFWTIKYNSAGTMQWNKVYDYVDDDNPVAMVVDASGKVFICGDSDGDASTLTNYDYQTVAYSSAGSQLWQTRFDGAASNDDFPADITISGTNLYITGKSDADATALTVNDIVTQQLNSSSGALISNVTYAGAGLKDDAANAILSNATGFVIIGYEENALAQRDALIKQYNTSGSPIWQSDFNGIGDNNENIRSIVVDNNNDVFVSGYSIHNGNDRDFNMVKFSNTGAFACEYSKNGNSTGSEDDAQEIGIDLAGNIIAAGFVKDKGTSNNLYYAMIKPSTCDTLWTKKEDGPGHGSDRIYAMARDAAGNFLLTGRVDSDPGITSNDDGFVRKIDANGTTIWTQYYNSASNFEDRGTEIAADLSGNVIVAGKSWNGSNYDLFVQKYSSTGSLLWNHTYDGGFGDEEPHDMTLDQFNNIYVVGQTEESVDSIFDFLTIKYDSSGAQVWVRKYNGSGLGDDVGEAISVDPGGYVYITGYSDRDAGINQQDDMLTIQYDAAGILKWEVSKNGLTSTHDAGDDNTIVNDTTLLVTGHINKGTLLQPNYDCYTALYDHHGNELWSDAYNSLNDSSDIPNLIYVKGNDFYVAGSSVATGQMRNMMVIKYHGLTVGLPEITKKSTIKTYPNPFNETLVIENTSQANRFTMTDLSGKKIFEQSIQPGQQAISLEHLDRGAYQIHFFSNNTYISTNHIIHY